MMNAEMRRFRERPPEVQPTIDALEVFLVRVFLRRYVSYCARRRRFAAMNGAARLFAEVRAVAVRIGDWRVGRSTDRRQPNPAQMVSPDRISWT